MIIIQTTALLTTIIAAPFVSWSPVNIIIAIAGFYAYMIIGVSIVYHHFWAHRSFKFRSRLLYLICLIPAILSARGSSLAWVHIHRNHHRYADTDLDPHRPDKISPYSFRTTEITTFNPHTVADLIKSKFHRAYHDYYLIFLLATIAIVVAATSVNIAYFLIALPIVAVQITHDLWNYFSHIPPVGYTACNTNDNSRNVWWLFPLIMGEAWHNNHHSNPRETTNMINNWEIDPQSAIIDAIGVRESNSGIN
jgi:fatty-acid desaturase